ncbi:MAG: hypothetical protein AAF391_13665 [Bacteroidota bacterium]
MRKSTKVIARLCSDSLKQVRGGGKDIKAVGGSLPQGPSTF